MMDNMCEIKNTAVLGYHSPSFALFQQPNCPIFANYRAFATLLRSQLYSHPLAPPISRLLASTTADLLCFRGWPTVLVLKLIATEDFAHFLSPVLMICSYICSYSGGCFSNLTELHSISHLAFPAPRVLGLANFFPEARAQNPRLVPKLDQLTNPTSPKPLNRAL